MRESDATFAGYHSHPSLDEDLLVVFRVDRGWFWQLLANDKTPRGMVNGPFPTAEGAYLDAIDE